MANREERVKIFEDTKQLYTANKVLADSVTFSRQYQEVICEEVPQTTSHRYDTKAKVIVSKKRSLRAAQGYEGKKVCVLNFASATNPGGGVEKGSNAQEEAICRCSTLFPCIADGAVVDKFHNAHRAALKRKEMTPLYNDDCIYTPDVVVFKSDTDSPMLMPEKDWYKVDIISCAAPNLRSIPSNAMNPDSGSKGVKIKDRELLDLHVRRMSKILGIAKEKGAEVVILGAFGCGAFQNSPMIVSDAMQRVIREYQYDFEVVELAVYCSERDTKNYDAFHSRFLYV